MNKFIDIEWQIPTHQRDNYYVSIECLKKDKQDKPLTYDCCLKSQNGCNLAVCDCKPEDGVRIRLFDKENNLLNEKELPNKNFTTIVIFKNNDDIPQISVKHFSANITNIA